MANKINVKYIKRPFYPTMTAILSTWVSLASCELPNIPQDRSCCYDIKIILLIRMHSRTVKDLQASETRFGKKCHTSKRNVAEIRLLCLLFKLWKKWTVDALKDSFVSRKSCLYHEGLNGLWRILEFLEFTLAAFIYKSKKMTHLSWLPSRTACYITQRGGVLRYMKNVRSLTHQSQCCICS